jgi:cation transporter-like permease
MVMIAPALLFGLVTALELRNRSVRALDAAVVFLFAFFLAGTGVGHVLNDWLSHLLGVTGSGHPVPTPSTSNPARQL